MSEHFISRTDAEKNLLACAAYLGERINSMDGRAEAMLAVVPHYIAQGEVDLAAELANTLDDPFTRDRLLTAVAEKCAELDDDDYALQLAEAVEDFGLREQALERIGLQKASKNQFEKAHEIASSMSHPDGVLSGIAVKQSEAGLEDVAIATIDEIEHPGAAVGAFVEMAAHELQGNNAEKAVKYLDLAAEKAADIEHTEERARVYCDIGNTFTEAGRNDRAIQTFDQAKSTAEVIENNMHRDAFLSFAAQGFLHAGSLDLAERTLDLVADKTHIASTLVGYAREFWRKDERDEAIESLEEAYAIIESQHERETRDNKAKLRVFASIAAQFAGFEKGERAIEVAEKIQDDEQRTSALLQVASILTTRKEDEQARHAFRSIVEDGDRVFALVSMSDAKDRNDDRTGALALLNEAEQLTETVPQLSLRAGAYAEIGKRMATYGETENARQSFEDVVNIASEIRDESARVAVLANLYEVATEVGVNVNDFAPIVLQSGLSRSA